MSGERKADLGFMYVYDLTGSHGGSHSVYLIQLYTGSCISPQLTAAVQTILAGKDIEGLKVPPKPGSSEIEWRVRSYAAFVMTNAQQLEKVDFSYGGNPHPGFDFVQEVAGDGWTAQVYENKRMKHDKHPLEGHRETVRWDVAHGIKGEVPIWSHNSSDTNVGP
jgi:hypothetical protein